MLPADESAFTPVFGRQPESAKVMVSPAAAGAVADSVAERGWGVLVLVTRATMGLWPPAAVGGAAAGTQA